MITSVKHLDNSYQITYDNGMKTSCGEHNREYAEILEWVEDGNTIAPQFTAQELLDNTAAELEQLTNRLWQAATAHQNQYISDAAHAMVLIGAANALPKCLAVKAWGTVLWADYYTRKADIENASFDFTNNGAIPHTVFEIMEEVA